MGVLGRKKWRNRIFLAVFGLIVCGVVTSCNLLHHQANAKPREQVELTLVSFAVTRTAHEAIIPKFVAKWQQEHGQRVRISRSYGGSGAQTRAVADGLGADVVHLALGLDTQRLEKLGLIEPGWEKEFPNQSIVTKSVVALVTRPGNPQRIQDWKDLTKSGLRVITADPRTSGVARWNFLALWNAAIQSGKNEQQATDFVSQVYRNVPILARDAREATDAFFKQGQGDVLINYENELVLAQQKGMQTEYKIPDVNISIDNPVAIVDRNVARHDNREVVEAFVQFLFSPEAQIEFAKVGFRPVDEKLLANKEIAGKYPKVSNLGSVKELGGWKRIQEKFFADGAIFDRIQVGGR